MFPAKMVPKWFNFFNDKMTDGRLLAWIWHDFWILTTASTVSVSSSDTSPKEGSLPSYSLKVEDTKVFTVASVTYEQKQMCSLPAPCWCCYFTVDNTEFFRTMASQINFKFKLKIMMIIPVHECETRLVLTATPELCIFTVQSIKMIIVPSHLVASYTCHGS